MPGLFIYGVKDVVIVPEYLIDMDKCFAQGVDIVKLDAGHFVQDELPMDVANAINAFVEPYMQTNAILTHEE
jgi:pimeloyl-ACP methyl ester carboxylesterase